MCKIMEDLIAKETYRAAVQTAQKMLAANKFSYEEIAEYSSLPLTDVQALAGEKSA